MALVADIQQIRDDSVEVIEDDSDSRNHFADRVFAKVVFESETDIEQDRLMKETRRRGYV